MNKSFPYQLPDIIKSSILVFPYMGGVATANHKKAAVRLKWTCVRDSFKHLLSPLVHFLNIYLSNKKDLHIHLVIPRDTL